MTIRIETALIDAKIATPCLVLDRAQIAKNYRNFCRKMDGMDIFYAVKANPHPDILSLLAAEDAYFDCASFQEITLVLAAGGRPSNICFGSTLKKVTDIAKVVAPKAKHKIIGIRPGEKLHEQMISVEDSYSTYEYTSYYKILPQIHNWAKDRLRIKKGKKVSKGFNYSSDNNSKWMTKLELKTWININKKYIGNI